MNMKESKKVEHGIAYSKDMDSYYVNVGGCKMMAFPTYEEAKKYRDEVYAERTRLKIEASKKALYAKESKEISETLPYPFNAMKDAGVENGDPDAFVELIKKCTDREQTIMRMRYEQMQTLAEIGKEFGVQRERIRQIIARVVRKLHFYYSNIPAQKAEQFEREKFEMDLAALNKYREQLVEEFRNKGIYTEDMQVEFGKVSSSMRKSLLGKAVDMKISDLELSIRTYNCLKRAGIDLVSDITCRTYDDMMKVRNLGKKSLKELIDKLDEMDMHLAS